MWTGEKYVYLWVLFMPLLYSIICMLLATFYWMRDIVLWLCWNTWKEANLFYPRFEFFSFPWTAKRPTAPKNCFSKHRSMVRHVGLAIIYVCLFLDEWKKSFANFSVIVYTEFISKIHSTHKSCTLQFTS